MIHLRSEGQFFKLGLNITFTRWRLTVLWVWFAFEGQRASARGFTLSRRGLRWRSARWSVIDNYLSVNNFVMVPEEVLEDLKAAQAAEMHRNDRYAYIKTPVAH